MLLLHQVHRRGTLMFAACGRQSNQLAASAVLICQPDALIHVVLHTQVRFPSSYSNTVPRNRIQS